MENKKNSKVESYLKNMDLVLLSFRQEKSYKENIETQKRDENYKIQEKIYDLQKKQNDSVSKYDEIITKSKEEFKAKREILNKPIKELDRIIWLFRRPTDIVFNLQGVYSRVDRENKTKIELVETYKSKTTTLGLFVGRNDRPTNNYNVTVIGHSSFVDHDSYEFGLKTFGLKGWSLDVSGDNYDNKNMNDNLNHDIKFFSTKQEAQTYAKKGLDKLFPMLAEIKEHDKEFLEIIENENMDDYIVIIQRLATHYCFTSVGYGSGDKDGRIEYLINSLKPYMKLSEIEAKKLLKEEWKRNEKELE